MMNYSETIATLDTDALAYLLKRIDGKRKHKLITKGDARKLAKADRDSTKVLVKLFSIRSAATWYVTSYDGDRTLTGYVDLGTGLGMEKGDFDLYELGLLTFSGYGVPSIERDCYFTACDIEDVRSGRVS
jgi:hypothetical protein